MVACQATRLENDNGQPAPRIQPARGNPGLAAQATLPLADPGYGAGADLAAAAQDGLAVLVTPAEETPAKDNPCARQPFHYEPARQSGTCPQNRTLDHEGPPQGGRAGPTRWLPSRRPPRARPRHARSSRPANRSAPAPRRGASPAPTVGRAADPGPMAGTPHDPGTAFWPEPTTRRLPPVGGVGTRRGPNPMVPPVRHIKSAGPLRALARAPPAQSGVPAGAGSTDGKRSEVNRPMVESRPANAGKGIGCQNPPNLPAANWSPRILRPVPVKNLLTRTRRRRQFRVLVAAPVNPRHHFRPLPLVKTSAIPIQPRMDPDGYGFINHE